MDNKVSVLDLGPISKPFSTKVSIGAAEIEVQNTIPYEQFLDMLLWGVNLIIGDKNYISAPVYTLISDLLIAKYYTNLDLSVLDKAEVEPSEFYEIFDIIESFNGFDKIKEVINQKQLTSFDSCLRSTIDSIINYKNSALGILDSLAARTDEENAQLQALLDEYKDPNKFKEVRQFADLAKSLQTQ